MNIVESAVRLFRGQFPEVEPFNYTTLALRAEKKFGRSRFILPAPSNRFLLRSVRVRDWSWGEFDQCIVHLVIGNKVYLRAPVWLLVEIPTFSPSLSVPLLISPESCRADAARIELELAAGVREPALKGPEQDLEIRLSGDLVVRGGHFPKESERMESSLQQWEKEL